MAYIRFENSIALMTCWDYKILLPKSFINLNITIRSLFHAKALIWSRVSMVQVINCFRPLVYQKRESQNRRMQSYCFKKWKLQLLYKSIDKMKQYIVAFKCTVMTQAMFSYFQSFSFSTRDTFNRNYGNDLNRQKHNS